MIKVISFELVDGMYYVRTDNDGVIGMQGFRQEAIMNWSLLHEVEPGAALMQILTQPHTRGAILDVSAVEDRLDKVVEKARDEFDEIQQAMGSPTGGPGGGGPSPDRGDVGRLGDGGGVAEDPGRVPARGFRRVVAGEQADNGGPGGSGQQEPGPDVEADPGGPEPIHQDG